MAQDHESSQAQVPWELQMMVMDSVNAIMNVKGFMIDVTLVQWVVNNSCSID